MAFRTGIPSRLFRWATPLFSPPWLVLEHCLVLFLILSHPSIGIPTHQTARRRWDTGSSTSTSRSEGRGRSDGGGRQADVGVDSAAGGEHGGAAATWTSPGRLSSMGMTEGPADVFRHSYVEQSGSPTMAAIDLDPDKLPGGFRDYRGTMFRFQMGGTDDVAHVAQGPGTGPGAGDDHHDGLPSDTSEKVRVNLITTRKGAMRSGDLHNCTQFDVVLKGRVRLLMLDLGTREEREEVFEEGDYIVIPPRVPHLFHFLEDNCMIEWWACEYKAWFFRPYRERINAVNGQLRSKLSPRRAGMGGAT
ncbi:hypothetical protein CBR_g8869 [Chara braunii]|uniref:Cupin type-1 domain-containing protein n=1 Tax=Chara braunii TaxID=69332 RepID=A0A388KN49_CHABU|nr:hypothetical protein CBR_g8869 [Chara braunii]|eukprot:GBG71451.1 hypothetical protein CBR_g8869 [Chara braunii]